jgi:hypothetical protein
MGTGTTALAAIACGRNSIGVELDEAFAEIIAEQEKRFLPLANELLFNRINSHAAFAASRFASKGGMKYVNGTHGFPVMTKQETGIRLFRVSGINLVNALETRATYEAAGKLDSEENIRKEKSTLK